MTQRIAFPFLLLAIATVSAYLSAQVPGEESPGEPSKDVVEAFERLAVIGLQYAEIQAGSQDPRRQNTLHESWDAVKEEFSAARAEFQDCIYVNWPKLTSRPRWDDNQHSRSPPDFDGFREQAMKELNDARDANQRYKQGNGTREEVVRRWRNLARRFTHPAVRGEALFWIGYLYLQEVTKEEKLDFKKAEENLEEFVRGPEPLTSWKLLAEEAFVSLDGDDANRMRARSAFYNRITDRCSLNWLKAHLLQPSKEETPEDYVARISAVIVTLGGIRHTTAINMVADADVSSARHENLKWIANEHPQDPLVESVISRGLERPKWRHPALLVVTYISVCVLLASSAWYIYRRGTIGSRRVEQE